MGIQNPVRWVTSSISKVLAKERTKIFYNSQKTKGCLSLIDPMISLKVQYQSSCATSFTGHKLPTNVASGLIFIFFGGILPDPRFPQAGNFGVHNWKEHKARLYISEFWGEDISWAFFKCFFKPEVFPPFVANFLPQYLLNFKFFLKILF